MKIRSTMQINTEPFIPHLDMEKRMKFRLIESVFVKLTEVLWPHIKEDIIHDVEGMKSISIEYVILSMAQVNDIRQALNGVPSEVRDNIRDIIFKEYITHETDTFNGSQSTMPEESLW